MLVFSKHWRDILKTWFRETRLTVVDKSVFPKLFKKLYDRLHESWACAGFKASGLFPVDRLCARKKCLDYIPESSNGDVAVSARRQAVADVIMPQMSTETVSIMKQKQKTRKRVQMKYGEVLTSPESMKRLQLHEHEKSEKSKRKAMKRKVFQNKAETSKSSASQSYDQGREETIKSSASESGSSIGSKMKGILATPAASLQIDDFVVVCYNDRKYLGQIERKNNNSFLISFLQHVKSSIYVGGLFAIPSFKDVAYVKDADIFGRVDLPEPKHRDTFLFHVNAHLW